MLRTVLCNVCIQLKTLESESSFALYVVECALVSKIIILGYFKFTFGWIINLRHVRISLCVCQKTYSHLKQWAPKERRTDGKKEMKNDEVKTDADVWGQSHFRADCNKWSWYDGIEIFECHAVFMIYAHIWYDDLECTHSVQL